jgi:uncharacterized protein YcnI
MKQAIISGFLAVLSVILLPAAAFAHVVVTPKEASTAQRLIFNVSVPNEKAVAVTNLKLLVPDGVTDVTPTSKDGWNITTTKNTDGEIASISWAGTIPTGERQDFSFSAQAPARATELDWKAYQTYADDSTVHWDQAPTSDHESEDAGPYSVTKVTNASSDTPDAAKQDTDTTTVWGAYAVAGLALIVSVVALVKKK